MERHGLVQRAPASATMDVIGRLCGLHAQVASSAEAMLAVRVEDPPAAQDLLDRGELVKTWSMRGTLHLLPAHEYGMWQAAFSTFDNFLKPAWSRASGLWPDDVERLIEAVGEALDGALLTREELAAAVEKRTDAHTGRKARESWGAVLKPAAWAGRLVYGPSDGRNVRFTAPPPYDPVDPDQALLEVTRRYLALNGPATREDFKRWWGIQSPARAGKMIEALGDEAVQVDVEGEQRWLLAADVDEVAAAKPSGAKALVPAFDQYVVGLPRDVEALLPAEHKARVYRQAGWLTPCVIVDGRVAGVWSDEGEERWA